jgi:hypothetical protein
MPGPTPTSVEQYLANLPADRRAEVTRVHDVVNRKMPKGFERMMGWGVITWAIPLTRLPDTYNGQPLCYVALGTHKSYNTLYLMGVYGSAARRAQLEAAFKASGKKMDMGKSCLHFQRADDVPLDAIGKLVAAISSEKWVAIYQESRAKQATRKALKPKARKTVKRKP